MLKEKLRAGEPVFGTMLTECLSPEVGPLLAAPLFELLSVVSFVMSSVVMLLLLDSERRGFLGVIVACLLIQFAFVAGSFYAVDLSATVTPAMVGAFSATPDRESVILAAWIRRRDEVIGPTAREFAGIFAAYLVSAGAAVRSKA